MKKWCKNVWWVFVSLLAAWAPGMDLSVQRKLRPDAFEAGGYVYQAIGRTFASIGTDQITMIIVILAVLWLTRRYLWHKPKGSGIGEYLLCGFFSVMQLLNAACNQCDTVAVLYENVFQLLKSAMYLTGMFVLFLCAVRALNELLRFNPLMKRCARWDKNPFWFPFAVLCIAWLPHLIIKYPGVLTIDTVLQYHQYLNWRPRTTPHPPFGSLVYGWLLDTAAKTGQMNLFYFVFTMLKTIGFIAILAYSLSVMNRKKIPMWVCWFAFALYAVSPVYVGWTTVLSKDSSYLIGVMLAGSLMMETFGGVREFMSSRWRLLLLAGALVLMMLVRHNGITIAIPLLAVLVYRLIKEKAGAKNIRRFACYACAVVLCGVGIEEAIIQAMDIQKVSQDDFLAIPMMQTARIVRDHQEDITPEEAQIIDRVFEYDTIAEKYDPDDSDGIRYSAPDGRTDEDIANFLPVWWSLIQRHPATALDAMLHMNGVLFDLQDNNPIYVGLTDHSMTEHVYKHSFNDMRLYNSEAIKPLNGWQRALTEWYYCFDDLPLVGGFASMGFCMELMLIMCYLCVINRRNGMLPVMIPALVAGVTGLFCPIVYSRYLLPMMGGVPLWFAGWWMSVRQDENKEAIV
ncbi:MAG: hypothetical protein J6K55_03095 [Clostridia bacterium]|nr:hypothetical protein [Clostridia bacterium]